MIVLKPIISQDDPRMYRRNRGGLSVIVKDKIVLHLFDIEYFNEAMNILRDYNKLMWYLKQKKGAMYSCIPNEELYKQIGFFEKFTLCA